MPGNAEEAKTREIKILEALAEGRTRDDIARQFGLKNHASLDQYMRRRHYVFDPYLQTYKKTPNHPSYSEVDDPKLPFKVTQILMEFRSITADPREVASRLGFKDHKEMAAYMREQRYEWNSQTHNYQARAGQKSHQETTKSSPEPTPLQVTTAPQGDWGQYLTLLQMLTENRSKLITLLDQTPPRALTIPRYALKGGHVIKSVNLTSGLEELVRDFTIEKKMSQREVFEVALIQFFFRYGFGKRVEELFVNN